MNDRDNARTSQPLPQADIERILLHMSADERDIRLGALRQACGLQDKSFVDPLLESLHDPDEEIRALSALALAGYDCPVVLDALASALNDESAWVRQWVVEALAGNEGPQVHEAIVSALQDPELRVRGSAISYVARTGDYASRRILLTLGSRSADDRVLVARALSGCDSEDVRDFMESQLAQGNMEVVLAAHRFFLRCDSVPVQFLIRALHAVDRIEIAGDAARTFANSEIDALRRAGRKYLRTANSRHLDKCDAHVKGLAQKLKEAAKRLRSDQD